MNINHIARAFCVLSFCTATATAQPPQPTSPRDARDEFYFMTIANKAQIVMLEEERLIPRPEAQRIASGIRTIAAEQANPERGARATTCGSRPRWSNARVRKVEAPHGPQPERSWRRRESNDDSRQDARGDGCPRGRAQSLLNLSAKMSTPSIPPTRITSRPSRFRWRTICWPFHRLSSAMRSGQLNRIGV